ncbi:MAG TPA: ADP-ribosylglycohydrolase family protein [Candidatus Sumerlaeota bacterium]|nr:ADP-ribosylglycohydrolase family protein [Candidatus Sumerlaeota bacterium]
MRLAVRLPVALLLLALLAGCSWLRHRPTDTPSLASPDELRRAYSLVSDPSRYCDKVHGSWLGKLIGLALAQPVEGWYKEGIRERAEEVGAYPVQGYFPSNFRGIPGCEPWLYGNLAGSPSNDDVEQMLLALVTLRERGVDPTPRDIAEIWDKYLPYGNVASGVALYNIRRGIWPPESATTDNPYQNRIGGHMRVDIWGMVAPGCPALAADLAERDASLAHTGEGIYGARFVAAAVSLAMFERDPKTILTQALEFIPADCEYATYVRDVIGWHAQYPDWEDAYAELDRKYGFYPDGTREREYDDPRFDRSIPRYQWNDARLGLATLNGAACALALLYGEGDFARTICLSTMIGYDTDCNAGTVGAIVGASIGASQIPPYWIEPLQDTYRSHVKPIGKEASISAIARETALYGYQVIASRLIEHP